MPSIDFLGRRLIVSAYAYYVLDRPIVPDANYDKASKIIASRWPELHPDRQWALGGPREIATTGYHIRYSVFALAACFRELKVIERPWPREEEWFFDKGRRFVTAAGYFDPSELEGLL
jgi:hypothetical protein